MYKAKAEGKNNFQLYSEELTATSSERLVLESSLRRALEHDEFVIHYQPKMDARSTAIVGVEALIRWHHPRLGVVAPGRFLSIAEETGLIVSIGKWVLRTACLQNMAWRERGLPALTMAVNLSRRQFFDEGLLRDTISILGEARMSPAWLELEIAESTVMQDVEKAMMTLKALKALGVRVAIDGFGAGYSSLTTLSRFPIDTIKIDGSFVRGLCDHAESRRVADAIIAMGRTLSLTVIAEGVETKEQADFLRARACDELQGLYFSKAVSADELTELLEAQLPLAA
jgi:EAL domain-containing protein (putative c-di-GMP-specific phosphodiesterase class I)